MSHGVPEGVMPSVDVLGIQEAPSLERASFVTERHVSRTGHAESHWTRHPAKERSQPGRLLIVGGLGGIEEAYFPVAEEIAAQGLDVFTMELPTYQTWHHQYHTEHLLHPERLLAQMVLRIIHDINAQYGPEPIDTTGHSTGGPATVQAAERKPQLFNSVTLWQPAGLSRKGLVTHALRTPQVAWEGARSWRQLQENFKGNEAAMARSYAHYFQNTPRRFFEAIAVTRSDISDSTWRIQQEGVQVGGVLATRDKFFPKEEILQRAGAHLGNLIFLKGCHLLSVAEPEAVAEAQLVLHHRFHEHDTPARPLRSVV